MAILSEAVAIRGSDRQVTDAFRLQAFRFPLKITSRRRGCPLFSRQLFPIVTWKIPLLRLPAAPESPSWGLHSLWQPHSQDAPAKIPINSSATAISVGMATHNAPITTSPIPWKESTPGFPCSDAPCLHHHRVSGHFGRLVRPHDAAVESDQIPQLAQTAAKSKNARGADGKRENRSDPCVAGGKRSRKVAALIDAVPHRRWVNSD